MNVRKSKAISSAAAIAIVVILIAAAGAGIYYYATSQGGQSTTTTTTTGTATTSGQAAPSFVNDKSLVYETAGNFQWLDPSVSCYQADYGIFQNVFEKLIWFSGDNSTKLILWLTTDLGTSSNNGHTWVFLLRQGITFADGTPFNSTAVWFSFTRLLILDGTAGDQSVHGSQATWIIQQLLNKSLSSSFSGTQSYDAAWVNAVLNENFVQIIDAYTVQFNLISPFACMQVQLELLLRLGPLFQGQT